MNFQIAEMPAGAVLSGSTQVMAGPVKLRVEFYALPASLGDFNAEDQRPGNDFIQRIQASPSAAGSWG